MKIDLVSGDALIIVDVQNDFLPSGSLAVPKSDGIISLLNCYIKLFYEHNLPVFATRDWHPPDHCSFQEQGGVWPPHCIAETPGAAFVADLKLPPDTYVISKATTREKDAYSGFSNTQLHRLLQSLKTQRVFVCGVATEHCILHTVKDALRYHYEVFILEDAICAIKKNPGDDALALKEMVHFGATLVNFDKLAT